MNELTLQIASSLKIVWLAGFSLFYGLGGMSGKWKRRYIGAFLLCLGVCLFSLWEGNFNYWFLLYFPLLVGALSMGYGGSTFNHKLLRRTYCGIAYAITALPIAIITGQWVLFAMHSVICIGFSVVLGLINPVTAREEETMIAVSIGFIPLFMV